jgi:hypothetical protein
METLTYSELAQSITVGQKYTHYKGNLYTVLNLARTEGHLREVVIYQDDNNEELIWVRPIEEFLGLVALENGQNVPRFAPVKKFDVSIDI